MSQYATRQRAIADRRERNRIERVRKTADRYRYYYGERCVYCSRELSGKEMGDHVPPVSVIEERPTCVGVLLPCCTSCNLILGAFESDDYRARLRHLMRLCSLPGHRANHDLALKDFAALVDYFDLEESAEQKAWVVGQSEKHYKRHKTRLARQRLRDATPKPVRRSQLTPDAARGEAWWQK